MTTKTISAVRLLSSLPRRKHAMIVSHNINLTVTLISIVTLLINLVIQIWKINLKYPGSSQPTHRHSNCETTRNGQKEYRFRLPRQFMTGLDRANTSSRWHGYGIGWYRCGMGGMGIWAVWAACHVTLMVNMTGLEPSNHHQNPLEIVHRYHSDQTWYQFDFNLAKPDIKRYQLNQTWHLRLSYN